MAYQIILVIVATMGIVALSMPLCPSLCLSACLRRGGTGTGSVPLCVSVFAVLLIQSSSIARLLQHHSHLCVSVCVAVCVSRCAIVVPMRERIGLDGLCQHTHAAMRDRVCVRERDRQTDRQTGRQGGHIPASSLSTSLSPSVALCVALCVSLWLAPTALTAGRPGQTKAESETATGTETTVTEAQTEGGATHRPGDRERQRERGGGLAGQLRKSCMEFVIGRCVSVCLFLLRRGRGWCRQRRQLVQALLVCA